METNVTPAVLENFILSTATLHRGKVLHYKVIVTCGKVDNDLRVEFAMGNIILN